MSFSPETVIHLSLEAVGVVALSWLGLRIQTAVDKVRLEQAEVKAALTEKQNDLSKDFNAKHAENTKAIEVHQAEDRVMFEGISRTLTRIDSTLRSPRGH